MFLSEAEYTLNRNIKYVSIIVQHGYHPEGWLKEIAEHIRLDCDVKPYENHVFEERINELFKRLANEGIAYIEKIIGNYGQAVIYILMFKQSIKMRIFRL